MSFISVSSNIFGARNGLSFRKRKQISDMLLEREDCSENLWNFKIQPLYEPDTTETRPITRCCEYCLPNSHFAIVEDVKHFGLGDCLSTPLQQSDDISRFWQSLPTFEELKTDQKMLLLYESELRRDEDLREEKKNAVLEALSQLKVWTRQKPSLKIFKRLLRFVVWLTKRYLASYFEEILVHEGQVEMIKDLQSKCLPVIYVPLFRSSFDKAIFLLVMANFGLKMPSYIPGYNENYSLTHKTGGIGPPRLALEHTNDVDMKYSSALATYIRGLLKKENGLLLNLESRRSRTGRPSAHVYGAEFLRVILDEYKSQAIEDAYFVSVAISYELLPDTNDMFGQTYANRESTGLMNIFTRILSSFFGNSNSRGKARIDFSQPVCIRQLYKSLSKNTKVLRALEGIEDSYIRTKDCTLLRWDSKESLNSVSPLYGSVGPLYKTSDENEELTESIVLDVLSHHLLYDAGRCESIMPTHLLAFVLVKKFKNGADIDELRSEMDQLIEIVKRKKKDFGFDIRDCDTYSIIFRGIQLLQQDLVTDWDAERQTCKITPKMERESLLRLEYYANSILPLFMMEAIISTAIFSVVGTQLTVLQGFDVEIEIKDDVLMRRAKAVYEFFTGGFILHAPCLTSESAIRLEVGKISDAGFLSLKTHDSNRRGWYDDDYDDYEDPVDETEKIKGSIPDQNIAFVPEAVKVIPSKENFERLHFARSLAFPYLEIFSFLMQKLKVLVDIKEGPKEMQMSKLRKFLFEKLLEEADVNFRDFGGIISMDTVRAFLSMCEDKVIYSRLDSETKYMIYELDESYADENGLKLEKLANQFLFYVTA